MPFCNSCGTDVTGVKFCSKCGAPVEESAGSPGSASAPPADTPPQAQAAPSAAPVANDNVLGAVAYVTIIPAIIFLLIEPYNKNRFVRFHSLQMLLLAASWLVLWVTDLIITIPLSFIPIIGTILGIILGFAIFFGMIVAWLIAVIKAYNGEEYRLPIIGDLAAKYV